jgi:redox-sensitive bicupin YhaK (pirin superfamily)
LDDFHSRNPEEYQRGFPWHPHRGIETITYVLAGEVAHADSLGNQGVIGPGDVQWMTAGSGIIHQEMPRGNPEGLLWGFQLWANLPARLKMTAPQYRGITANEIPRVPLANGVTIGLICGKVGGQKGPVQEVAIAPEYLDVRMPAATVFVHPVPSTHMVFAYVIEGEGRFDDSGGPLITPENLVVFRDGEEVRISAGSGTTRFLLISGKPLEEPVAWHGPIVMNTQEELETAFREYQNGTFLKDQTG